MAKIVKVDGKKIQIERVKTYLTQTDLAEMVGVTKTTILNIENWGRTLETTLDRIIEAINEARDVLRKDLELKISKKDLTL